MYIYARVVPIMRDFGRLIGSLNSPRQHMYYKKIYQIRTIQHKKSRIFGDDKL